MIIKIAQIELDIENFYKEVFFNPSLNIRPPPSDRVKILAEAISNAERIISAGGNPFDNADNISNLLGGIDESSLSKYDKERNLFNSLSFDLGMITDLYAEDILLEIKNSYEKYKNLLAQTIYTEEVSEEAAMATSKDVPWYVSSDLSFNQNTSFYGPFDQKLRAILFSILTHNSGDELDKTVLSKDAALSVLRSADSKIQNLNNAVSPQSGVVRNKNLTGMVEQVSREKTSGQVGIELSVSGSLFEELINFIRSKISIEDHELKTSDVISILNQSFITSFVDDYLSNNPPESAIVSAPLEFNKVDTIVSPPSEPTETKKKKDEIEKLIPKEIIPEKEFVRKKRNDTLDVPEEVSAALTASSIRDISIFSKEDPEILSDVDISNFIQQMKEKASAFLSLDQSTVSASFEGSVGKLNEFFKNCLEKDLEIKNQIINFRKDRQFAISSAWTPESTAEWEFENKFSISKRVISDSSVSSAIKHLFSLIAKIWFMDVADKKLNSRIEIGVKSYVNNNALKKDQYSIEDAVSSIQAKMIEQIDSISRRVLETRISDLIASPDFSIKSKSFFAEEVLQNIKITDYISKETINYFQTNENVIDEKKYYALNCGVCGQVTQVPTQYKQIIESFGYETSQYSFFREDGSIITEQELSSKSYGISDEAKEYLSRIINAKMQGKTSREVFSAIEKVSSKTYSWREVNELVAGTTSISGSLDDQISSNIIGHIVRNDILKSLGASTSGSKSIFANKTLCASSLLELADSFKQDQKIVKKLEKKKNFSCLAKIKANYLSPDDISVPEYQYSAYSRISGSMEKRDDELSGYQPGYRFSRNIANCPCLISSDSSIAKSVMDTKKYEGSINYFAIPRIPDGVADSILEKPEFLAASKLDLNYPPTMPDGSLAFNASGSGYLICGKKVSISLFDKDPSSQNYIRNVLTNILKSSGKDSLVSAVKTLIDYGVEINDIKPHVEAILSGVLPRSVAKKTIKELFKLSKFSLAQTIDSSTEEGLSLLKDLGLVCEHGHKFTLEQSWKFAKTHSSVLLSGGNRAAPVPNKNVIAMLNADPDGMFKIIASSYNRGSGSVGLGLLKVKYSEEDLRKSGFITPSEAESMEQLNSHISSGKIFYKSDDGSVYVIGNPQIGLFLDSPWEPNKLSFSSRTDMKIKMFASGQVSTTTEDEDGGVVTMDIPVQEMNVEEISFSDEDDKLNTREIIERYSIFEVLFPGITKDSSIKFHSNPEYAKVICMDSFSEKSVEASKRFINLLRLSRTWGLMAIDSQIDFLSYPNRTPEPPPNLIPKLEEFISSIARNDLGIIEERMSDIQDNFRRLYDVSGLIERNTSYDKFLSLATIAQYYAGFSTPNIINLNDEAARNLIKSELVSAVKNNLSSIFEVDEISLNKVLSPGRISEISSYLAELLYSPYSKHKISDMMDKKIVDYTGRAIVLSYAVDMVENIRSIYQRYFLNKESSFYIGSFGSGMDDIESRIQELISMNGLDSQVPEDGDLFVPNILKMNNELFEEYISIIQNDLKSIYRPEEFFISYISSRGVPPEEEESPQYAAQQAIVFARFSRCFDMAISSIDHVIADLGNKSIGSKSIKSAAKTLDRIAESLILMRDPSNFEQNKERILEGRMLFGEAREIFESNAVQYGRISLDSSLVSFDEGDSASLAPITFGHSVTGITLELSRFSNISERDSSGNEVYRFSRKPYLILLKKISISKGSSSSRTSLSSDNSVGEAYICIVPRDIKVKKLEGGLYQDYDVDILSLISKDLISLNNKQGSEFLSRYIRNLGDLDLSRVFLADVRHKKGYPFSVGETDSAIESFMNRERVFDIRVQKIDYIAPTWPPPNNLLFDNYNVSRDTSDFGDSSTKISEHIRTGFPGDKTQAVGRYYNQVIGSNIDEFIQNLNNFGVSVSSKTAIVSSSHGVVLPVRMLSKQYAYDISNVITKDSLEDIKTQYTLSNADIKIPRDGGPSLDISWAFMANDPQFLDESGLAKTRLIQSGIVQKLQFISLKMNEIFSWFSNEETQAILVDITDFGWGSLSFDNLDSFISSFFSDYSPFVSHKLNEDGIILASLTRLIYDFYASKDDEYNPIEPKLSVMLENARNFTELYNAAVILNKKYKNLTPLLDSVTGVDLAKKENRTTSGLCLRLLDPYSMWYMVTNPMMRTSRGGPINEEDVEDYKSFIASTFGLENIRKEIIRFAKLDDRDLTVDDLFDLNSAYRRLSSDKLKSESLILLARLLKLTITENGEIDSYGPFGFPKKKGVDSDFAKILASIDTLETSVDSSSYLEYPTKIVHSLNDLSNEEIKKIIKEADESAEATILKESGFYATMELEKSLEENPELNEDALFLKEYRKARETYDQVNKVARKKILSREENLKKKELLIRDFVQNNPKIVQSREFARAVNSGERLADFGKIYSMKAGADIRRQNDLSLETIRIAKSIYAQNIRRAKNNISWRKFGQSATEDEGNIMKALYHKWWDAYLNIMAKNYNQE